MKRILKSKLTKNYIILFSLLFITEIILKLVLGLNVFSWALLRIFISCSVLALLLGLINSFLPEKVNNFMNIFFIFAFDVYAIFQVSFSNFMGTFMSVNASSQLGKVFDYMNDYLQTFSWEYYLIFIPFLLIVLYYLFINKRIKNKFLKIKKNEILFGISMIFILFMSYYVTLTASFMQNKFQTISNKDLFYYPEIPNTVMNEMGITAYAFVDVKSLFVTAPEANIVDTHEKDDEPKEVTDYTRIIDDTVWQTVADAETNSDFKKLNNYFMNRDITDKNEKTGYFKDKNLIVILMESINTIPLKYPEYFPTFNKIYNEGWAWVNSYSPRNSCATGNNEMSVLASLYTINNSCTANTYKNNKYYEAMFNLFLNQDYYTSSYHDYADHYYYRKDIHKNMGSLSYSNAYDLGISVDTSYSEWPSDVELIEASASKFINKDKFMTFYSTVTSHRPYTLSSTYGDKNLDMFEDLDISKSGKRYLSKVKELDSALELLLKKLEETGKLDDTVIVLFADHYPYGLSNSAVQEFFDYDITENYERDRTPFVIYNSTMEPKKYEDYTTFMNILPTLANLFDLDYDPRLYMGTDLFSKDYESMAIFTDGSWQNDLAFYNAKTSDISYIEGSNLYADEEIMAINNRINEDIQMSNLAIRSNYFEKLNNKMNKVKESMVVEEPTPEIDEVTQ